jgi:hypothetical protein
VLADGEGRLLAGPQHDRIVAADAEDVARGNGRSGAAKYGLTKKCLQKY